MAEECQVRRTFDQVQYQIFLVPEYEKDKGLFVLKAHHSLCDGLAAMQWLGSLSDVYDKDSFASIKPMSCFKRIMVIFTNPFVTLFEGTKLLLKFAVRNQIKNAGKPIVGKRNGWFSNDLDLTRIKKFSKQIRNCTVNDYTTTLLSTALFEYFETHQSEGQKLPKSFTVGMPFSLREAPAEKQNVRLNNDFASMPVEIKLFKHFDDGIDHFKTLFGNMKNSLAPFGVYSSFRITTNLPYRLPKFAIDLISDKFTMIYSNLNASKKPIIFCGHTSKGQFYFVPSPGKLGMGDLMRLGIYADESFMPDVKSIKDLVSIYER